MKTCVRWAALAVGAAAVVSCAGPMNSGNQAAAPAEPAPLAQVLVAAGTAGEQPALERVALITEVMPTGIAVSREGRIFLSFPRWGDPVENTVMELKNGKLTPYPNAEINRLNMLHPRDNLVSVQSVVVDGQNRLWLLDTGNVKMAANLPEGPKLVSVDLGTNEVKRIIHFPESVAKEYSYLNDVRFDLKRGKEGTAYITDSSSHGQNGIVVVDLATGDSWRKLDGDKSVLPETDYVPVVEGIRLMERQPSQPPKPLTMGSDGIALAPDGSRLYWRPLVGQHLYSIDTKLLADRNSAPGQVAAGVQDHGALGFASDGMLMDPTGILYLTDYEHHAIRAGKPMGQGQESFDVLVSDPLMIWPDTLALGPEGYLYMTVNQLNRQPRFNGGKDLRKPPYEVFRVKAEGGRFVREER